MKKKLAVGGGAFLAVMTTLWLLGAGDIIDLPEWANIPGIDIPLIGDNDAIDCKLRQIDDTRNVRITIIDGDKTTYSSYVHVWNNGNLIEATDRPLDEVLIVSSDPTKDEQFYAISIDPVPEGRVFCESLILE